MEFRKVSLAGDARTFIEVDEEHGEHPPEGCTPLAELKALALAGGGGGTSSAEIFATMLSAGHTVLLDVDPLSGAISYNADSPDEVALVKGGCALGYDFVGRDGDHAITVKIGGREVEFEVLEKIEFTSHRKRMSVLLRQKSAGKGAPALLLVKGADSAMLDANPEDGTAPRTLDPPGKAEIPMLREQLQSYAVEGLRTLVFAYREVRRVVVL